MCKDPLRPLLAKSISEILNILTIPQILIKTGKITHKTLTINELRHFRPHATTGKKPEIFRQFRKSTQQFRSSTWIVMVSGVEPRQSWTQQVLALRRKKTNVQKSLRPLLAKSISEILNILTIPQILIKTGKNHS